MGALSSCSLESQSRSIAELIETGEIFFKEPYITNPVSLVVEFLSVFLLFQFGLLMVAQKWVHYFKVLHFFLSIKFW